MRNLVKRTLLFVLCALIPSEVRAFTYDHFYDGYFTSIHVLTVNPKEHVIRPVKAEGESVQRETVATLSARHEALAGVNGGFWKPDGRAAGILKIDGQWYGTPTRPRAAIGWTSQGQRVLIDRVLTNYGLFDLPEGAAIEVLPQSDLAHTTTEEWKEMEHIVGGTPVLVSQGNLIEDFTPEMTLHSFLVNRFPRTAVGIKVNGDWVFVVVDNSFYGNVGGLTMKELAQWMFDLGCINALNLCGGRSSTLVIDGVAVNAAYGQAVSDAILIFKQ